MPISMRVGEHVEEDEEQQQELDALGAALDGAVEAAGLALEMKLQ